MKYIKKNFFIIASFFLLTSLLSTSLYAGEKFAKTTLAGGCFWCMESDFQEIPGVRDVVSGYIGGRGKDPTYRGYSRKGFIEAVEITYDPSLITYNKILDLFWLRIDPTDASGQFCDRGHAYSTAIFYKSETERSIAEKSKARLEKSARLKGPVATKIIKDKGFYQAETYHQDYYTKNPLRYKYYRYRCGRDERLKELWGVAPAHK